MKKYFLGGFVLLSLFASTNNSFAQDLLEGLEEEPDNKVEHVKASYKNSRVINAQSLETTAGGQLDFRISHRFGAINGGAYQFFGLDQATMRLGLDYGITDRLQVGLGRSNYEKTVDGYFKYRILWQTQGSEKMPLSLLVVSGMSVDGLHHDNSAFDYVFPYRLNYHTQLIVGRKFSKKLTAQMMGIYLHRNLVQTATEKNDVFLIAGAGRMKVLPRLAITAEYFYALPNQLSPNATNSLSLGFDIETGGHVFQLHVTNSPYMVEKSFMGETTGKWTKGDIFFGFNISRVFDLRRQNKK